MLAVKGIYDGTAARPIEEVPLTGNWEVIIIFLEPSQKESTGVSTDVREDEEG